MKLASVVQRPAVLIPAVALAALMAAFWCWKDLDPALARQFVSGQSAGHHLAAQWPLKEAQPWQALYRWGVYPAWLLGGGGAAVCLAGFVWPSLKRWRAAGLFYALLLLLGPGLIVNVLCKPYWKRPRPRDTAEVVRVDGLRPFVPVGQRGRIHEDRSFPSGHAAMAFYLMAPAFVLYRRRRRLAAAFLILGLTYGSIMGAARIVAGGHFATDVLGACGVIYFTALALSVPFHFGQEPAASPNAAIAATST
ncbi:MAG: phosphatase PAP2 family protein [Thermoguttaceae bacterium]